MGSRRASELSGHLETLFRFGTASGLSDVELLDRFVSGRDEAGEANFRALVARHGPMVLRVCRSVLDDPHDAEDAFQVTFLALARKAGSIRKQGSLGSWLHGTAHRVACKARTAARRRVVRESHLARQSPAADASSESRLTPLEDGELSPILHEEIERLPAKYRAPIVLCYLQGMTQEQAAVELGWPAGTVRGRLARAREILKSRLTRRGLALSAGLAAAGSPADAASGGLSAALAEATVRAALGHSAAGRLSRTATLLLSTVYRNAALARWVRLAVPLLFALVAGGVAIFFYQSGTKLSGERTPRIKSRLVSQPVAIDLAGDPLPEGALSRLGTTRFLHGSNVQSFSFSPDGATLASFDGALYLWDAKTGRELHRIETGVRHGPIQFAYAPDGRSLAVPCEKPHDAALPGRGPQYSSWTSLFDAKTGQEIRRFEGKGTPSCLAFSPDGKVLAAGITSTEAAGITLWDVASGHLLRSMGNSFAGTVSLVFSPHGKVLISCISWTQDETPRRRQQRVAAGLPPLPEESSIQLWDVASGNEIRRIGMGKSRIKQAALAPNGESIATGATDKTIRLWDLTTGREVRRFGRGDTIPYDITFSPDGTKLVSTEGLAPDLPIAGASPPMTAPIHVWNAATGQELRHWETDDRSRVCFSPDGMTLATVGTQVIRLWDISSGQEIRPQTGHRSKIEDAAFTPDLQSVMTLGRDRTIRFWDAATGKQFRQFDAGDVGIRFAALSADGKTVATGGGVQPTRLWDVAAARELRRFQSPGKISDTIVECADLSPDGKTLATSGRDGVIFWDTATGECRAGVVQSRIARSFIKALRFAPDGRSVATVSGDWVRFWDIATARETRQVAFPKKGSNDGSRRIGAKLAYSADGKIVAATSAGDGIIFLLDVPTGRELGRLDQPENQFKALAFSPDGKILATGVDINPRFPGRELAIRLWDVTAQKELGRVKAHHGSITALAFSPDGKRLLSASEDATALVWDVTALIGRGGSSPLPVRNITEGTGSLVRTSLSEPNR